MKHHTNVIQIVSIITLTLTSTLVGATQTPTFPSDVPETAADSALSEPATPPNIALPTTPSPAANANTTNTKASAGNVATTAPQLTRPIAPMPTPHAPIAYYPTYPQSNRGFSWPMQPMLMQQQPNYLAYPTPIMPMMAPQYTQPYMMQPAQAYAYPAMPIPNPAQQQTAQPPATPRYASPYNPNQAAKPGPRASTPPPATPTAPTKPWGDTRYIWPDFYTDFTGDAWDKIINAPYDLGYMPGGWRFPSFSSPDPVTVGDAVTNQMPPIMEEIPNFMNFNN